MTASGRVEHEHRTLESAEAIFAPVFLGDVTQTQMDEGRFAPVVQASMRINILHVIGGEISLGEAATGMGGHGRHGRTSHLLASPAPGMGREPE
jgi:hypothetical protein